MTFADTELEYQANGGLDDIIEEQRVFVDKYNITAGDLCVIFPMPR